MDAAAVKGKVDFGIITIREDELEAVLDRFPEEIGIVSGRREYNLRRLELDGGDTYTVAIVRCAAQGNGEAQQVANALLEELAPRWLLVVGIGGAAPAFEHTLGDVVVSTEVADFNVGAVLKDGSHEYALGGFVNHADARKHAANLPALRGRLGAWNSAESIRVARPGVEIAAKSLYGDAGWKKKVKATLEHHLAEAREAPKVTAGAIACSDLVMKDAELLQVWLKIARQVIAVEMESAGVHRAAHDGQVPFLSIRGLSDVVGFVRDPRWTRYACHSAAAFTRAFLLTRPIAPREVSGAAPVPAPAVPSELPRAAVAAPPPRPERFVGREVLADRLIGAVLREPAASVVLLGPAGIGKSTLTAFAMHRPAVVKRFGARRWFVRLDTAPSAEAAVGVLASALGLIPRGSPLAEVCAFLAREPGVLALDNLETPWEGERGPTEDLLRALAAIDGLVLVASVRGAARPGGVAWTETIKVPQLDEERAAELFCDIAQAQRDDPALPAVLERLGGVPLAITLLAHVAEGASLAPLIVEWDRKRTALLAKEGVAPSRETSWAVSLALSLESPRMTPEARRLAALLGTLPDGVAHTDVAALLPGEGEAAQRTLVQVGLAYDEGERVRVLAPVREYLRDEAQPSAKDLGRAMEHYGELARELGPRAGATGGAEAVARLAPETANLDAMIREGLRAGEPTRWIDAATALTEFARLSGRARPPLEEARAVAHGAGDMWREAKCIHSLGDIALQRSDHEGARNRFEQVLPLYEQVGDVLGEANCILSLGNIALRRSDHEDARSRFEQALPLYEQVGDVLGEANCIDSLGDIALRRSDDEGARNRFEQALPLYKQVGDVLGEANCIRSLGNIALRRSDHEEARSRFEQALPVCQQVGDVLGEANCILLLGDIALERSDHEGARSRFEQALPLYKQVGAVLGEANCILRLGDIALERSDLAQAKERYDAALALYAQIPEPYSMGGTHRCLARIATDPAEKQRHIDTARALWTSIDRPDLVTELDAEFLPLTPTPK